MLHQIGVGALGPVFRTYEPSRDRLIAVKVFRLDVTPEQAEALADELSRAAEAGLFHPSIVEPVAAGVQGTVAYRAEEYVAAESLDVAIRHYAPAPIEKTLPFITQLAGAIDFARAAGIGHGALHLRDVFVTPDEARASGFGVVEALERAGLRAPVRRPYSAPERIAGEKWGTPADVFSLAAVAYELLSGRRAAGTGDQIGPLPRDTGGAHADGLRRVLARAMDEDPAIRYQTALAFASALEAAARGEQITDAVAQVGAIAGASPEPSRGASPEPGRGASPEPEQRATTEAHRETIPEPSGARPEPGRVARLEPGQGAGSEPSRVARPEPSRGARPEPGQGAGSEPSRVARPEPGRGAGSEPSRVARPEPGRGARPEPGRGAGSEPSQVARPEPGQGAGSEPSQVARPEPGRGARPEPGRGAGPEPGRGAGSEPSRVARSEPSRVARPEPGQEASPEPSLAVVAEPTPEPTRLIAPAIVAREPEPAPKEPEEPLDLLGPQRFGDDFTIVDDDTGVDTLRIPAPVVTPPISPTAPDEEVRAIPAPEPPRTAMLPLAVTLIIGLLVGFAAGYSVGSRDNGAPESAARTETEVDTAPAGRAGTTPAPAGAASSDHALTPQPGAPPPAAAAAPPSSTPAKPAAPAPTTGRIVVQSTPSRAGVMVNGDWRGRTTLTLDRQPFGDYEVRVVQPGYGVARETFTLSQSAPARTVNVRLERTPAGQAAQRTAPATPPATRKPAARSSAFTGGIYVDSRPRGAKVFVDGKEVGTTPLKIPEVAIGAHVVRLELADHQTWTSSTRVAAGEEARVTGSLERIR